MKGIHALPPGYVHNLCNNTEQLKGQEANPKGGGGMY